MPSRKATYWTGDMNEATNVKRATENAEYVHRLLEQKQPGFAASLEFAVSLAETSMEQPMDDVLTGCPRRRPASPACG